MGNRPLRVYRVGPPDDNNNKPRYKVFTELSVSVYRIVRACLQNCHAFVTDKAHQPGYTMP